jgi:hypothetical protein
MIEREQQDTQQDEVPTDEQLDVEGPNESTQPSQGPLDDQTGDGGDGSGGQ